MLVFATQVAISGQPNHNEERQFAVRAFYGDKVLDRVVVIDVPKMELEYIARDIDTYNKYCLNV